MRLSSAFCPGPRNLGEESLSLAVPIDNVAHIAGTTLKSTETDAAKVFGHAGIGTRWLECSFQEAEHQDPPGCQLPLDVPVIIVKILAKAEAQRWSRPDGSLGYCLNNDVYLMLPRLQAVAEREALPISLVLAVTLAHEIGHSLLGAGHAREGIMCGVLRTSEWRLAARGQLLFAPKDVRGLRDRLWGERRRHERSPLTPVCRLGYLCRQSRLPAQKSYQPKEVNYESRTKAAVYEWQL